MARFKTGDTVMLKTGGLSMTISDAIYQCIWFDEEDEFHRAGYSSEQLKRVEKKDGE